MEKNGYTPAPISADEAAFRLPPPSYEEIMGAYQTSIKEPGNGAGPDIPHLAYIDIMPRCLSGGNFAGNVAPKFGDYSTILDAANRFLQDNAGMAVWKCESVTKRLNMSNDGRLSYELNTMLRHESTFGFLVYIKGLSKQWSPWPDCTEVQAYHGLHWTQRQKQSLPAGLWLTKDPTPNGPPQQLGLRTVVPEKMTVQMPTRRGYYRPGKVTVEGVDYQMTNIHGCNQFDTFERLGDTIERLEKKLEEDPIPGTILTIETDKIKAYEQFKKDIDPEATCWTVNKDKFRRFTQVIRIFYIKGTSAKEQISYHEFLPELISAPDMIKPGRFEPFVNLLHKLAAWVSANQGVRIVNIQQYDAKVDKNFTEVEISSDCTDEYISTFQDQRFARILRVFYTKSSAVNGLPANFISSRLFLPARIGPKSFECMTQTIARIDAWLRVTGLPVYSVETVELLFSENIRHGAEVEKSDYNVCSTTGKHWVTAIRVYFTTPFSEPDPALLPPMPMYSNGEGGSGSCSIL